MHALVMPGVASTLGIEIDSVKCAKARVFVKQTAAALKLRLGTGKLLELPSVQCCPVEKVGTAGCYGCLIHHRAGSGLAGQPWLQESTGGEPVMQVVR